MTEWWTYHPSDFLMFSARAYARLAELTNAALWPWQFVLLAGALAWCLRPRPRAGAALLATAWATTAWFHLHLYYAPINWPAEWLAWAFGAQAAALLVLAVTGRQATITASPLRRRVAAALGAWALVGHPLVMLAGGRRWMQAEWFGAAPDPTVVATLGVLLLLDGPRWLWVVPVGAALVSAATLATLGSVAALTPLVTAAAALGTAWATRRTLRHHGARPS